MLLNKLYVGFSDLTQKKYMQKQNKLLLNVEKNMQYH